VKPKAASILLVPLVAALVLTLFAWPSARVGPRDLPVGVAGPAAPAAQIERQLSRQQGAFEVTRFESEDEARTAIEGREVYGAFVAAPEGAKVLTASSASPVVAQLLDHAAKESGARVEDVVPIGRAGAALGSSVLPLLLAGILTGALAAASASSALGRAALVAGGSVLAGLAATAVIQGWLDVVEGDWWANAGTLTLTVLAVAAFVAGLHSLMGEAGIALAALVLVLVGNPFSAIASAPELLPQPVGGIGQLMPPGAGGNMLRSTGFFDGAGAGGHAAVLAVWTAAGLALLALRARRIPARAAVLGGG
jgi:hypothetical protein